MKILVALAFVAILGALALALVYMMRSPKADADQPRPAARKGGMVTALALRVGLSILLFLFVLLSWKMGWIAPTGIPSGA